MSEFEISVLMIEEKMLFSGEIYAAGKNFTLPPALTALTNSTSGWWAYHDESDGNLMDTVVPIPTPPLPLPTTTDVQTCHFLEKVDQLPN